MRLFLLLFAVILVSPAASCQQQTQGGDPPTTAGADSTEAEMGPQHRQRQRQHMGQGQGQMGQGRMGQGAGDGHHDTIHALLADHEAIERRVEDVPGGVETWTTSDDPEVADLIRVHVRQMYDRLEAAQPVRRWDPLFAAIFEHADAIEMVIEDIPGGLRVLETSDDPEVVALIRQHAHRAVSEFVERGMDRAHEPTPLPGEDD